MMNIVTIAVEEAYFGVEAQSFNADTQSGRDKAKACFVEMLNGYDVPHNEDAIDELYNGGGVIDPITSVKVIKSIL